MTAEGYDEQTLVFTCPLDEDNRINWGVDIPPRSEVYGQDGYGWYAHRDDERDPIAIPLENIEWLECKSP